MTSDPRTSSGPTPSDEDLSTHLDGPAAGEPAPPAPDLTDPATAERLADLSHARDALRTSAPEPLAPSVVDRLVARAVEETSTPPGDGAQAHVDAESDSGTDPQAASAAGGGPGTSQGTVTELSSAGRSARPARRMPPTWLVAASVALLLAVGLGLVWNDTRGGSGVEETAMVSTEDTFEGEASDGADPAAPSAAESGDPADGGAPESPSADGAGDLPHGMGGSQDDAGVVASEGLAAGVTVIDLGVHPDVATLRSVLAAGFPTDPVPEARSSGVDVALSEVQRCAHQTRLLLHGDDPAGAAGTARAGDEDLMVFEYRVTPRRGGVEETVGLVTTDGSCRLVTAFVR